MGHPKVPPAALAFHETFSHQLYTESLTTLLKKQLKELGTSSFLLYGNSRLTPEAFSMSGYSHKAVEV